MGQPSRSGGGRPSAHASWLAMPLGGATRQLLRAPRIVLAVALTAALASLLVAGRGLGFRGNRLDLLDRNSAYNRRWIDYLDEFGSDDDVVVVVAGPGPDAVLPALDALAASLDRDPQRFQWVFARRDLRHLRTKALHFAPEEQFQALEALVTQAQQIIQGEWATFGGTAVANWTSAERVPSGPSAAGIELPPGSGTRDPAVWPPAGLEIFLAALAESLIDPNSAATLWGDAAHGLGALERRFVDEHLLYDHGRLGLIPLRLAGGRTGGETADRTRSLSRLREIMAHVQRRHQDVGIGVTGMPVLESDEMRISGRDTARASAFSLVGVAALFAAALGGVRRPMFAVAVLLLALSWTLGYATLTIGHLNILSAAFGVILIGLGIDFSIHYLANYGERLETSVDRLTALVATAGSVGPGIVTGGVTSALAFATAGLTDFKGVAELGFIASAGILFCVGATMFVMPVLLFLWDPPPPVCRSRVESAGFLRWLPRHAGPIMIVTVVLSLWASTGISRLRYDHNLLNLQPANLEAVDLERTLARHLNRGIWYAVSMSETRGELLRRQQEFQRLPSVSGTEEIASLLPESPERAARIARLAGRLDLLPRQPHSLPVGARAELLRGLGRLGVLRGSEPLLAKVRQIAELPPDEFHQRLSRFHRQFVTGVLETCRRLRWMAEPEVPRLQDLPQPLSNRFVGRTGKHLLRVFGRGEIWDMAELERFVSDVESVDRHITGHPVQTFYASRQMQRGYLHAAIYALLAVSIVLMLDFRQIRLWLLALLPVALAVVQLLGLLGWLQIPLNPANMIVLPLILGIGIDDGVHVVHDFLRQRPGAYRLSRATGKAIVLTSVTTMIGFGSLMFASHRGLRSLGQVLTLGVMCCLVSSIVVLPPLLRRVYRSRGNLSERSDVSDRSESGLLLRRH